MINQENYEALKEKYGHVASWAVWKEPGATVKSNTGDLTIFENTDLLSTLNPKYAFIALNGAGTHDAFLEFGKTWFNFHSNYPYQNDYKLRFALMNTPYWGSYITDVIKELQEVDSNKVKGFLKKNPTVVEQNIQILKKELSYLDKNVVLVALGNDVYDILQTYFNGQYTIKRIKHYSYTISKENYRVEVLETLAGAE